LEKSIISRIKSGDSTALLKIYKTHRNDFIHWAITNYQVTIEEAKDVFQEVVIDFYESISENRLTSLTCELKTYLFQMGKFKLINLKKKEFHKHSYQQSIFNGPPQSIDNIREEEHAAYINYKVTNYMNLLCDKCRLVIELFYLKELPLKQVAKIAGYKNEEVAKKKRYECFKKLTEIYKREKNVGIVE
jgi:RNA polymerase sigma factor (sigma-70 family)